MTRFWLVFGTLVAATITFFFVVAIASAAEPNASLEAMLTDLQTQWRENEQHYLETQDRIHRMANFVRKQLCDAGEFAHCTDGIEVSVSSYNPLPEQTDSTPCHGAGGNVCEAYGAGKKPIALSWDLIATLGGGPFRMGDKVRMFHDTVPGCNGVFTVLDTMHSRWERRADIFSPEKALNVGCSGAFLVKL